MDNAACLPDPVLVILEEMARLDALAATESYADACRSDVIYSALVTAACHEVPTTAEGVRQQIALHFSDADRADDSDAFRLCFRPNTPDFVKEAAREAWRDLEAIAASASNGRLGAEDAARAAALAENIECLAQPFFAEAVRAVAQGVREIAARGKAN